MRSLRRRLAMLSGALALVALRPSASDASCIPGFDYAAFGKNSVKIGGGGTTDSYNSGVGGYSTAPNPSTTSGGNICTDGTANGAVTISGGSTQIGGDICYGAGGSSSSENTNGGATIDGSIAGQGTNASLPSVTSFPAMIGTDQGNLTTAGPQTLSATPNNTWDSVNVGNGDVLTLNGGTYVWSDLTVKGEIKVSGAVTIYLNCSKSSQGINMNAGALMNVAVPQTPSNLLFFLGPSCATADIEGGANEGFAVYAPDTDITLHGGSTIFGAIVGKSVDDTGGVTIHYDTSLGSLVGGGFTCPPLEISRSAPVLALINTTTAIVQGTFTYPTAAVPPITSHASLSTWKFPLFTGHMRGRTATTITTTASTFSTATTLFDVAGNLPARSDACAAPVNGTCRFVFTNTNTTPASGSTFHPTMVTMNDANSSAIVPLICPGASCGDVVVADYAPIQHTILDGVFGGVDRSTVAVIQPSTYTSSPSRPTVAYFGGLDGMLHAVCASTGGTTASQASSVCPALGRELWAFLPRVQLPLIRTNGQRLDGSVHVIDAFGDFTNNPATGTKSWKTILVFQTGYTAAGAPGAAYALDVTDPASPVLLWEYTAGSTPATVDFGAGMTVATGPALIGGVQKNFAVLETNNGGSTAATAAGAVTTALYLETGTQAWQTKVSYPSTAGVPVAAIPGGAVGVDLTGNGFFTDFVEGDLYGELWRLRPLDGASVTGTTTPLFAFAFNAASDEHPIGAPPSVYSDGTKQYVAFPSGGYANQAQQTTAWSRGTQSLVAVQISATTGVTDTASVCNSCTIRIKQALDVNTRGYSQATIAGNQMFVTSDEVDVNASSYGTTATATGHVLTVNGLNGTASFNTYGTSAVYSGASSVAVGNVNGTTVIIGSSSDKQRTLGSVAATGTGTGVGVAGSAQGAGTNISGGTTKITRSLWLRTQ